jgi:hypothetical protein
MREDDAGTHSDDLEDHAEFENAQIRADLYRGSFYRILPYPLEPRFNRTWRPGEIELQP